MNPIRERAKEHFPTVLLTLLSIVQALSLELWWQYLSSTTLPSFGSMNEITLWLQIVISLLTVVVIWVIYAGTVMRFRWVPGTSDSIFPFAVGLSQFMLIETLYMPSRGLTLAILGLVFLTALVSLQLTMRRARHDSDNELFFGSVAPATLLDFAPFLSVVVIFLISGALTHFYQLNWLGLLVTVLAFGVLIQQLLISHKFWKSSMEAEVESEPMNQ